MRDRFNRFVERHDAAWDLAMALSAIAYVAVGFALDDPALQPMAPSLERAELGLDPVTVIGPDDYRLDGNHDGVGCQ
jgi:hypothetical protein